MYKMLGIQHCHFIAVLSVLIIILQHCSPSSVAAEETTPLQENPSTPSTQENDQAEVKSSVAAEEEVEVEVVVEDTPSTPITQENKAEVKSNTTTTEKPVAKDSAAKEMYKYGFQLKRYEQIEGVKRILELQDHKKRKHIVGALLAKLFTVMESARQRIEKSGYIPQGASSSSDADTPNDGFPEAEDTRDAMGNVLENIALFGDLLLRLPDLTHKLYDKQQQWNLMAHWAVKFANQTGIFEGPHAQLIDLVSQELGIVPRRPDYQNPYRLVHIRAEENRKKELEAEAKRIHEENQKRKKKEKKKKKRRGPRLGGRSEL